MSDGPFTPDELSFINPKDLSPGAEKSNAEFYLRQVFAIGGDLVWANPEIAPFAAAGFSAFRGLMEWEQKKNVKDTDTIAQKMSDVLDDGKLHAAKSRIKTFVEYENKLTAMTALRDNYGDKLEKWEALPHDTPEKSQASVELQKAEEKVFAAVEEYLNELRSCVGPTYQSVSDLYNLLIEDPDLKPGSAYASGKNFRSAIAKFSMLLLLHLTHVKFYMLIIQFEIILRNDANSNVRPAPDLHLEQMRQLYNDKTEEILAIPREIFKRRKSMVKAISSSNSFKKYQAVIPNADVDDYYSNPEALRFSPFAGLLVDRKNKFVLTRVFSSWATYVVIDAEKPHLKRKDLEWESGGVGWHMSNGFLDEGTGRTHRAVTDWDFKNEVARGRGDADTKLREKFLTDLEATYHVEVQQALDQLQSQLDKLMDEGERLLSAN